MFAAASFFAFVAGTAHAQNSPAIGIDENDRVVLRGNVHPALAQAKKLGHTDPQLAMQSMILVLKRSPQAERDLDELLKAQQDPRSALYHQWLTPEQFGERFGPSAQQIQNITRWLTRHGFTVDEVAKGRGWINFSGNVAQVEDAFQTEIDDVEYKGERHHANTRDPSIPRALSGMVEGIRSLHDFRSRPMHRIVKVVNTTSPDFSQGGQNFMSPEDFATIYDVKPLYNAGISGAGQTIAIVGRNDIHISDVRAFRTLFGLPAKDPVIIHTNADPANDIGEEGEAILDVSWSGAVAKSATVDFVVSSSTASSDGVDLSAQYVVNHNLAPVMSTSFGLCEAAMGSAGIAFYNNLWSQAASQGIASMVSAGDSGAAGCDDPNTSPATGGQAVSGLCTTANNICVGGTEFSEGTGSFWGGNDQFLGSALSYIPEVAWNESGNKPCSSTTQAPCGLFSGGGGPSSVNAKPSWQVAAGVPNDGARDTPDVSLNAAGHDGYMICQADSQADCSKGSFGVAAGTSAASPSFAGLMALVTQKSGQAQGNANMVLYPMFGCFPSAFHDVTSGNNSVPGATGFLAGAGYDLATGLGSVDAALLVNNWAGLAVNFTVNAPAGVQAGVPFSVTVTAKTICGAQAALYRGTVHFASTDPRAGLPIDYKFNAVDGGVHTFNGVFLGTLSSQTITVTDTKNSSVSGQASVLVGPGPAASFNVTAPASTTAGAQFNNLMVTAADQFGNTPATYGGTVHFTSSDAQAVLPANSMLTNGTGTFSATLKSAGRQFISATDTVSSSISGTTSVQVNAAAASQFSFTVPQTAQSGTAFNFRLTAKDPFGNVADGYRGTVTLTSTDGGAAFVTTPYTYTSGDAGKHIFGATLNTLGSQTISANDSAHGISKTSSTITVGTLDPAMHALPLNTIRMFRPAPPVVVAQFTDDDTGESGAHLTASIDWGDGQTDTNVPITCTQGVPNVCTVSAGHQYATKGRFSVNVNVTDNGTGGGTLGPLNSTLQFGPRNLSF